MAVTSAEQLGGRGPGLNDHQNLLYKRDVSSPAASPVLHCSSPLTLRGILLGIAKWISAAVYVRPFTTNDDNGHAEVFSVTCFLLLPLLIITETGQNEMKLLK